jgi:hypothetical protein
MARLERLVILPGVNLVKIIIFEELTSEKITNDREMAKPRNNIINC